jgi:hypothetical protein
MRHYENVSLRTLTPLVLVRIQVPQPIFSSVSGPFTDWTNRTNQNFVHTADAQDSAHFTVFPDLLFHDNWPIVAIMDISRLLFAITFTIILLSPALAQNVNENVHQARLCAELQTEVTVGGQMRADCISDTHAIEIDFAQKWKEGIGQALAYGVATGLRPGLVLVCERSESSCLTSSLGLRQTLSALGYGITVWECRPTDERLEDCNRLEFGPDQ